MGKYRSRTHWLILYPEDTSHMEALKKIEVSYDYLAILHDRDYFTEKDEKQNPEHVAGTLKKPHYHVCLRFNNYVWNTAICKNLGIPTNYIEEVKNFNNALLYLIHYNDTDKAQYDIDETFGNLKLKLNEILNKVDKSEGERVVELIEFIDSYNGRLSVTHFAHYCAKNGYWAEFRRSGAIFCKIIEEKNNFFDNKRNIPK